MATKWTVSTVRANPLQAFDMLNVEKNLKLTLQEVMLVPEHLEKAVPMLKALGVPMDMKMSRPEFSELVKDKRTFSDAAVAWLAELCQRREGILEPIIEQDTKEDPELTAREMNESAVLTAISLHRATRIRWRNDCLRRMAKTRVAEANSQDTDLATSYDLVMELVSAQFTLVDSAFYDALNIAGPASASIFVVVYDAETHAELGRTETVTAKTAADWPPLKVDCDDANSIFFSLFALGNHVNIFIGKTAPVPVPTEFRPPDDSEPTGPVVALGPLDLVAAEGCLAGRIFGVQKWARDPDLVSTFKCKSSWCLANTCLGW